MVTRSEVAHAAEMWTGRWGIKGISLPLLWNQAPLLWTKWAVNYAPFWISFGQAVDRVLIDRHESNQRSNKHYRF